MAQPHWVKYLKPIRLDCSYPEQHADHHMPHPDPRPGADPRLTCYICHPPVRELERRRREQAAE